MKITPEHYAHIKQQIANIWTVEKHIAHKQFIANEGKVKDIEKRLRWDWSYYAKLSPFICDNIYTYADDTHVDTALKNIIKELTA